MKITVTNRDQFDLIQQQLEKMHQNVRESISSATIHNGFPLFHLYEGFNQYICGDVTHMEFKNDRLIVTTAIALFSIPIRTMGRSIRLKNKH